MAKNIVFQYLVLGQGANSRAEVNGLTRKELYRQTAKISRQSFEVYAKQIGAEYWFATDPYVTRECADYRATFFEMLRIVYDPFFDDFDNVLYVDCDVVANTHENIFDVCDGEVAGVLDSDHDPKGKNRGSAFCSYDFERKPFIKICDKYEAFNVPVVPTMPPNIPSKVFNINTGVMVWTKEARLKARKLFDPWIEWLYHDNKEPLWLKLDQFYISAMLIKYDFDVQTLHTTWNDCPIMHEGDTLFNSNFLHYSGGDWKGLMLQHGEANKFKLVA